MRQRPRRASCAGCGRTHRLLPSSGLLRHADVVVVIGAALVAKAAGGGHRPIAASLGRPAATVRGWLRRFSVRAEDVRVPGCRATSGCCSSSGATRTGRPRPTSRPSTPGTPTRHRRRCATSGCCERVVGNAKSVTNGPRDRRPQTNASDTRSTTCSRCDLQRYVARRLTALCGRPVPDLAPQGDPLPGSCRRQKSASADGPRVAASGRASCDQARRVPRFRSRVPSAAGPGWCGTRSGFVCGQWTPAAVRSVVDSSGPASTPSSRAC